MYVSTHCKSVNLKINTNVVGHCRLNIDFRGIQLNLFSIKNKWSVRAAFVQYYVYIVYKTSLHVFYLFTSLFKVKRFSRVYYNTYVYTSQQCTALCNQRQHNGCVCHIVFYYIIIYTYIEFFFFFFISRLTNVINKKWRCRGLLMAGDGGGWPDVRRTRCDAQKKYPPPRSRPRNGQAIYPGADRTHVNRIAQYT